MYRLAYRLGQNYWTKAGRLFMLFSRKLAIIYFKDIMVLRTVNSENFAIVLFSRNFANAKFREN